MEYLEMSELQTLHMQINGQITYNGETFDKFIPQRTSAYIAQVCHQKVSFLFPLAFVLPVRFQCGCMLYMQCVSYTAVHNS